MPSDVLAVLSGNPTTIAFYLALWLVDMLFGVAIAISKSRR